VVYRGLSDVEGMGRFVYGVGSPKVTEGWLWLLVLLGSLERRGCLSSKWCLSFCAESGVPFGSGDEPITRLAQEDCAKAFLTCCARVDVLF